MLARRPGSVRSLALLCSAHGWTWTTRGRPCISLNLAGVSRKRPRLALPAGRGAAARDRSTDAWIGSPPPQVVFPFALIGSSAAADDTTGIEAGVGKKKCEMETGKRRKGNGAASPSEVTVRLTSWLSPNPNSRGGGSRRATTAEQRPME